MRILLQALICFVLVLLLVPQAAKLAHKIGAVDKPNERKIHKEPIPSLGGLAIYLGFTIMAIITQDLSHPALGGLVGGGTLIVLIGIADDVFDIKPRMKLLGQIAAALILALSGTRIDFLSNPFTAGIIEPGFLALPLTIIWVVGIINAINLIDGIDGLAAGTCIIVATTMAVLGKTLGQHMMVELAVLLAAASAGFLRYNFNPASIFMGDTGSMFLGYNLAALSIMGLSKSFAAISIFVPILILGVPILDTFFAIVRRLVNTRPIFMPDKEHLHHRLLEKGLSQKKTVMVIYVLNIILGVAGIMVVTLNRIQALYLLFAIMVLAFVGARRIGIIKKISKEDGAEDE